MTCCSLKFNSDWYPAIFSDMTFQDLSAYVQQKRGADTSITSLRSPAGEAKGTVPGVLEFGQYSAPSLTFFGKVPDSVKSRFPGYMLYVLLVLST